MNGLGRTAIAVAITALLAACASTHGLAPQSVVQKPDQLATPKVFTGANVNPESWPDSRWWTQFGDPQLNQLIEEGIAGSPTLRVAEARTRAALAQTGAAKSALFPQVDSKADTTREHFPANSLIPPPYAGTWDEYSELQATLNWEVDFWGKNRANYQRALGEARAAAL